MKHNSFSDSEATPTPVPPSRRRAAVIVALILVCLAPPWNAAIAAAQQIWFTPKDWFVRPGGDGGSVDYMTLFQPAIGQALLSRISVFKVGPQFLQRASDQDLRTVFAGLTASHVALAVEAGVLDAGARCGAGTEGYGGQGGVKLAARIKQLGGELAYIAMDEPVGGAERCHEDLTEAARSTAKNIAAVKAVFPNVRVGDIESIGANPVVALRWIDAYRAAASVPLAFYHADVPWSQSWQAPLEKLSAAVHSRGIPFGVIYNATKDAHTDREWIAQAMAHVSAVEADPRIVVDEAVFQSWQAQPSHIFPADDPGTFSHLLNWYFARHPR